MGVWDSETNCICSLVKINEAYCSSVVSLLAHNYVHHFHWKLNKYLLICIGYLWFRRQWSSNWFTRCWTFGFDASAQFLDWSQNISPSMRCLQTFIAWNTGNSFRSFSIQMGLLVFLSRLFDHILDSILCCIIVSVISIFPSEVKD